MKKTILIFSVVAALATCGFIATNSAAADNSGTPAMRGNILQRIAEKLGLTAGQKAQIKTILLGEKAGLVPLLSGLHDARTGLRTAIRATDANEASVRAASAKVAAVEADLAVERMKLYGKIAPLLTPEQLKTAADMQSRADEAVDSAIARLGSAQDN